MIGRDLIIGLAQNYDWTTLEPFAMSVVNSGFSGDVVLFVNHNNPDDCLERLRTLGFTLVQTPSVKGDDAPYWPYVGRFLLVHHYLQVTNYRYVFAVDTRDLIFQHNPSLWMEQHICDKKLVAASEFILHKDQAGNMQWLADSFRESGAYLHNKEVYCSGVIAGLASYVSDLCLAIYFMGKHLTKSVWGADQPVYNMLMHSRPYADISLAPRMHDAFAVNCVVLGDCFEGDRQHMTDMKICKPVAYLVKDDGTLLNWPDLSDFVIIHQYDRISALVESVHDRYRWGHLSTPQITAKF